MLALLSLLLGLMCGMRIMPHVSPAFTSVFVAWTYVRDADYVACA